MKIGFKSVQKFQYQSIEQNGCKSNVDTTLGTSIQKYVEIDSYLFLHKFYQDIYFAKLTSKVMGQLHLCGQIYKLSKQATRPSLCKAKSGYPVTTIT